MSLNTWLFFSGTEALLCLTPGPAVLFVLSFGLARGGRASLWANAGILSGNGLYFTLSALGLGAVLVASHGVFTIIKYVGAAYLIYLGARTMLGAGLSVRADNVARTHTDLSRRPPPLRLRRVRRSFSEGGSSREHRARAKADNWQTLARGFALQAANPKALIFFAALLPQFIDTSRAVAPQVLILGVTSVIIEFFVLAAYGYLAARAAAIAREPRFAAVTNRVSGGMLIAAGTGIALSTER